MGLKIRQAIFILILVICSAGAVGNRAAMVLETRGDNSVTVEGKTADMRTLQVLPDNARIEVGTGGRLRLSYFKSGIKEVITGPCRLLVREESSKKLSDGGKIEVKARRNASTELDKTNNLRRMGGALQANATETPSSAIVALGQPEIFPQPGPHERTPYTVHSYPGAAVHAQAARPSVARPEFTSVSPVYLTPEEASKPTFKGAPVARLSLVSEGETLWSEPNFSSGDAVPAGLLQAGGHYQFVVGGDSSSDSHRFDILSDMQAAEYRALVSTIEEQNKDDARGKYSELIFLARDLKLLVQAEDFALQAATSEEFKQDPGFWFALGEIQRDMKKKEAAINSFKQAKTNEGL